MYEPSKHLATFFIAGFQHWDGALALDQLKVGQQLELVPEFDNPHDPNCLALYSDEHKLGFVPKTHNELPALFLFYGHDIIEARILQVDREAAPWEQVRVGLYVKDARDGMNRLLARLALAEEEREAGKYQDGFEALDEVAQKYGL